MGLQGRGLVLLFVLGLPLGFNDALCFSYVVVVVTVLSPSHENLTWTCSVAAASPGRCDHGNSVMAFCEVSCAFQVRFQLLEIPLLRSNFHETAPSKVA